jgi:hypothetical protein
MGHRRRDGETSASGDSSGDERASASIQTVRFILGFADLNTVGELCKTCDQISLSFYDLEKLGHIPGGTLGIPEAMVSGSAPNRRAASGKCFQP